MATFEENNPVPNAAHGVAGAASSDIEAAAAALKHQGASDWPQTVEAMEQLMAVREAALEARLEARLAQAAPAVDGFRSVFAHLSGAPTNWHQSTVHFAALEPEDHAGHSWRAMLALLGGVLMVLGQCMVAVALLAGVGLPSCESSDQCQKGTYCGRGSSSRCGYCGQQTPLPLQIDPTTGGTLNNADSTDFVGFNVTLVTEVCSNPRDRVGWDAYGGGDELPFSSAAVASWCEACVTVMDMAVDPLTQGTLIAANVAAMGPFDWISLLFATFVVALTVAGELRDTELVMLAIRSAGDKLSLGWRIALSLLAGVRRWLFLPTLVAATPFMAMYKGGDALSVSLNSVAVLFLCEVDNIAYTILLSERVRMRVEEHGRAKLGDAEAEALTRSKAVHVALIMVAVVAAVRSAESEMGFNLSFLAFGCAGVVAAVGDAVRGGRATAGALCKGVAKAIGAWLLGLVGFLVLVLAAFR